MKHIQNFGLGLEGKTALVTGGTKGIGKAIAERLSEAGATVVVSARSNPGDLNPAHHFIAADVATAEGVTTLATAVLEQFGTVDILINNAGANGNPAGGHAVLTDEHWFNTLNLNLMAAVRLDKALLPAMLQQQSGVIIHVSSGVGVLPFWEFTMPYAAAKAALNNYSKSLSAEVSGRGVRVLTVAPGMVKTDAMASFIQNAATTQGISATEAENNLVKTIGGVPIGRMAAPEEVAALVGFLVSPAASYLTGVNYGADGGAIPVV